MRGALAVFTRELRSWFYSPIAYSIVAIFLLVTGYFFYAGIAMYSVASLEMSRLSQFMGPQELSLDDQVIRPLFGDMGVILLMMAPLITMRLFAEEKKTGSIEMLFTWPLTDRQVLAGKYLAAVTVLFVMLAPTVSYFGFIAINSQAPWGQIGAGYLGLLLMGASFMALGVFVSTLTENQVVAGAITFGALLIFWVMAWAVGRDTGAFATVLQYLSILEHLDPFTKGVIDTKDLVYYLSFIFLFLFFALRSLESNRWRG